MYCDHAGCTRLPERLPRGGVCAEVDGEASGVLVMPLDTKGKFSLPTLPYAENALEPVISARTISFHYGKHHKAYVDKLNELIAGTAYAEMPLEDIVKKAAKSGTKNGF